MLRGDQEALKRKACDGRCRSLSRASDSGRAGTIRPHPTAAPTCNPSCHNSSPRPLPPNMDNHQQQDRKLDRQLAPYPAHAPRRAPAVGLEDRPVSSAPRSVADSARPGRDRPDGHASRFAGENRNTPAVADIVDEHDVARYGIASRPRVPDYSASGAACARRPWTFAQNAQDTAGDCHALRHRTAYFNRGGAASLRRGAALRGERNLARVGRPEKEADVERRFFGNRQVGGLAGDSR